MNNNFDSRIDESINLELNVSYLYSLFHELFPKDADFWWQLALEEKNHGALIRSGKEYFEPLRKFPHNLLHENLQTLKETNAKLRSLLKKFKETPPPREVAFNIALNIENSERELGF